MEKRFLVLPFYFLKIKIPKFLLPSFRIFQRLAILFRFFYLLYRLRHQLTDRSVARRLWESSLFRARQDWSEEVGARNFTFPRDMQCFFRRGIRNLFEVKPVFRSVQNREKNTTKKWSNQPLPAACLSLHFILTTNFRFSFFTVRFAEASVDSVWSLSSIFRVFIFWLMLSLPAHCCWKRFRCINVQKRVDV